MNGLNLRLVAVLCGLCVAQAASAAEGPYLSPVAIVADKSGATLYVAEGTAKQLAFLDAASGRIKQIVALPKDPTGMVLSPDGTRLYVTCGREEQGCVAVVDPAAAKVVDTLPAGHTPCGPALSPDGKTLYVCNRFNNQVAIIDLASRKADAVAVVREPVAAALTPDGKLLVVANHLPFGSVTSGYISANVSIIDTAGKKVAANVALPDGCSSLRGVAIAPDGRTALVTHLLSRYKLPTTQLERGWMNTNAVSVIDLTTLKLADTVLVDDVDKGAANPWAIAYTADGSKICVTHAGTNELSVIDAAPLMAKLAKAAQARAQNKLDVAVQDDLSFLVGLRKRIQLPGAGARSMAILGTKVYVGEYFTDGVTSLDLDPKFVPAPRQTGLGGPTIYTAQRRGELLFNDANCCFQTWQSCASCHPDGRADGLNWDLLNDGIGNPKNTRSMLHADKHNPVMSLGVRETAEEAVKSGLRFIQFSVRPEKDAQDIYAYMKSIQPTPSPYLVNGAPSESARRGQAVFQQAGCVSCHSGPLLMSNQKFNLGLGVGLDANKEFTTPILVEIWRTAPYLYDGRAATLEDVLTKYNAKDQHGTTSKLSKQQLSDLVEYLKSL